jgi:nicotinamidase-related amidase
MARHKDGRRDRLQFFVAEQERARRQGGNMKKYAGVLLVVLLLSAFMTVPLAIGQEVKTPAKMKPALLVIDIQNAYLPYMSEQDKKTGLEVINYVISLFRDNGFPVIRVYHTDPKQGPKPGTAAFEFPRSTAIKKDDPQVIKNYPNAFKKTELNKILQDQGCNTLFLCGLSATGCVLATYHGGLDLDYNTFLVKDSLISPDADLTKAVQEICQTIGYGTLKLLLETAR